MPSPGEPKNCEIKEDRQCGCRFHDKSAEPVTDVIRCKTGENLMGAIENGRCHCVPKPSCHIGKLSSKRTRDESSECSSAFYTSQGGHHSSTEENDLSAFSQDAFLLKNFVYKGSRLGSGRKHGNQIPIKIRN